MELCSDDKVSSRNFSVSEGSQPPYLLSDMTPSDAASLPNFAVNRSGKAFKLSASDMPRITTSPLAKCHPSRDGCGEGPKVVNVLATAYLQSAIFAVFVTFRVAAKTRTPWPSVLDSRRRFGFSQNRGFPCVFQ